MHGLRLLRTGGAAGADGPDRLIRHHRPGEGIDPGQLQHRRQLRGDDLLGLPGLALLQRLTDTQDRDQAGMRRGHELAGDQLTAFMVVLTALGMADQAVPRPHVHQHGGRDLAGVGPLLVAADVLRAEGQRGALEVLDQVPQVGQRRQDHQLDPLQRQAGGHLSHQFGGELTAAMQLPVTGDDRAAHSGTTPSEKWAKDSPLRTVTGQSTDNAGHHHGIRHAGGHDGEGRLAAAFVAHFSLISRRRSSRKPCAVIGSGYRLGLSGVMHDGSTSIRKSGFGCRKNGTE